MLNELDKNGLSVNILHELSYESKMGKSLVNSLRKFEKEALFKEVSEMIRFYQEVEVKMFHCEGDLIGAGRIAVFVVTDFFRGLSFLGL